MDSQTAELLITFFETYNKHYTELFTFLTEKKSKVISDDLVWLLDSLATEQKFIMQGNSLESKRLAVFETIGISGVHSKELIEMFPENYRGQIRVQLDTLTKSVTDIKRLNADILDLVDRKLSLQEKLLNKTNDSPDTYNVKGAKVQKHSGGIIGEI